MEGLYLELLLYVCIKALENSKVQKLDKKIYISALSL